MSSISNIESDLEYDLSTDDSDDDALNLPGLASDGVPGLLVSVEFDDKLSAPVIENGKVRMPRSGGSSKPVEFGSGIASPISGVLVGMSFATGIGEIFAKNGEVYFPLAECTSAVCTVSSVPGAIAGVQTDSSITYPYISGGVLYLPAGGGESVGATFSESWPVSEKAGGLKWGCISEVDALSAWEGKLYFPLAQCPAAPAPGCTVSSIPGALLGAMSDEYLAGGGIYNGVLYFPLADVSSNRPGMLRGVTMQPDFPVGGISNGLLYFPSQDNLRGVVDTGGTSRLWAEVVSSVGEQFEVAAISLRVGSNTYVPLSLNVGRNSSGYLTFSFSS